MNVSCSIERGHHRVTVGERHASGGKAMGTTTSSLENRIFNAPGNRLFLVRALLGLDLYVHQFGTVTNWHRLFRECIDSVKKK